MELDLDILTPQEQLSLQLRGLYEQAGYRKYHMSRFEEYGLYQENRSFLSSEAVLTFTDLDGRLLALKPDVTLSIAKNVQPEPGRCERCYYLENVYRPSRESGTFREIRQMGIECIGAVGEDEMTGAVALAVDSLSAAGGDPVLELGHMGFVTGLLDAVQAPNAIRPALLDCLRDKNLHELSAACSRGGIGAEGTELLCRLAMLSGSWKTVLETAGDLIRSPAMESALAELARLCNSLDAAGKADHVRLDLSLVNDLDYYNGLILQGFVHGAPHAALRGGRYDPLVQRFTPGAGAFGFALYLDELERLTAPVPPVEQGCDSGRIMLNVALPKGRLGDRVHDMLSDAGYRTESYADTRKLVVENRDIGIRYFLVKPSDVAIYVEHGAADIGIVGKDILEESSPDVYELLDTGLGKCRMCVAAPEGFREDPDRSLRVATKFTNIAKRWYAGQGRDIDIIHLNGSIELAPILGLSDVIVDIVETGSTLRENHLKVLTEFMPISARLIANKAAWYFKRKEINRIVEKLKEATGA